MSQSILFLCPHSAAKSVIAAAYSRRFAERYGLDMVVDFAGTEPDEHLSSEVVARLMAEGIDVSQQIPRYVTAEDLAKADYVFSMGCDIESVAPPGTKIEHWDDVPSPSQDLDGTFDVILSYLDRFFEQQSHFL